MKIFVATLAALLLLALILWRPWETNEPPGSMAPEQGEKNSPPDLASPPPPPRADGNPPAPAAKPAVLSPPDLQRIRDAIDNLEFVFRDYAVALGGNPVGTNSEITAALLGDNAKQLKLEIPPNSSLNAAGELCDPWGTPWFFHQLSATKMEIRSAGPDRELYTADDFVR